MREDDMDDVIRKAAYNYDVDVANAADWNAVYTAVHETEELKPAEKKKRRRFMYWWLLLIPLGWIANTQYNKFNHQQKKDVDKATTTTVSAQPKPDEQKKSSPASSLKANAENIKPIVTMNSNNSVAKNNRTLTQSTPLQSTHKKTNLPETYSELQQQPATQPYEESIKHNNDPGHAESTDKAEKLANVPAQKISSDNKTNATPPKQDDVDISLHKPIKIKMQPTHYFYTGVMAGADLSFIKYQDAEPVGFNIGILAGYKFNKLSIESGLYFVKKNYYTDGEYFDKSKLPYFSNADIISVDGYCRMFEIPLNVKYDISTKKNHTWFATAGLSSYLMNKEFYNYDYIKDGEEHSGSRAYYTKTQNWLSVLNLSAGYQLKTGAKTDLRIEPYYKASLNGVGTGNLSITSFGVNAGLVRRIP